MTSNSTFSNMETPEDSSLFSPSLTRRLIEPNINIDRNANSPSSSGSRLWRKWAQGNLKNQWSGFRTQKKRWSSASSSGKFSAESLVNAHLLKRYMPAMDLGVLSNMVDIREKACCKLAAKQEHHGSNLLSSYKDMVNIVGEMVNVSRSLRCFRKGSINSPIAEFSCHTENMDDIGDDGGMAVFTFWSIPYFEELALELVQMFKLELMSKRLLVMELLSLSCNNSSQKIDRLSWSDELFEGEFKELNKFSEESCQPVCPRINHLQLTKQSNVLPDQETLEVYLTAWLLEVNINRYRVDDIFSMVGEEIKFNLS